MGGALLFESGFGQEFGDLIAGQLHPRFDAVVAHGAVLAGICHDFGAIDGHREVADLDDAGGSGEFEHLVESGGGRLFLLAAEFADRVVVRMGVAAEETHCDVLVGEDCDMATAEGARGVWSTYGHKSNFS